MDYVSADSDKHQYECPKRRFMQCTFTTDDPNVLCFTHQKKVIPVDPGPVRPTKK